MWLCIVCLRLNVGSDCFVISTTCFVVASTHESWWFCFYQNANCWWYVKTTLKGIRWPYLWAMVVILFGYKSSWSQWILTCTLWVMDDVAVWAFRLNIVEVGFFETSDQLGCTDCMTYVSQTLVFQNRWFSECLAFRGCSLWELKLVRLWGPETFGPPLCLGVLGSGALNL